MKQLQKKIIAGILSASIIILYCAIFFHVEADQTIGVTGTVPPQASDFQTALEESNTGTVPQNAIITYTITYGSHLEYSDKLTIEATWGQGTINGSTIPSVEGLDYVTGSASHAYNDTTPIVDTVNHKIDWTISAFPAQTTDQTVTFQLRTNTTYTGPQSVTFPIQTRLITPNFTSADETVTTTYQFDQSLVPTSTPTPTPLPTTPTPSVTPTLTPTQPPNPTTTSAFADITLFNLTSNTADISFIVKQPGTVTLLFGTSPTSLKPVQTITTSGSGILSLPKLSPHTSYYFQLVSTGPEGTFYSEIFTITTPEVSQIPEVAFGSLIIATDNDILYSPTQTNNTSGMLSNPLNHLPTIPLATATNYTLSFKLTKFHDIKSVNILLQNNSVLGIAYPAFAKAIAPLISTYSAFDKGSGVYNANITNVLIPGTYIVSIRIVDTKGNITTQQVANMHVLHPFRVYDATTKKPLPDVRITLYRFDSQSKQYLILPPLHNLENPLYTDFTGQVSEQLPRGNYKAVFSLLGHESQTVLFQIGATAIDDYPTTYLSSAPLTPHAIITYYSNALLDWLGVTKSYVGSLQLTYRYYNLFGLLSLFCLVSLTLLFFSVKSHIAVTRLHTYFHHHLLNRIIHDSPYISGEVIDKKTHTPLVDASITVIDAMKRVFYQTQTNKKGHFLIPSKLAQNNMLLVAKNGYEEYAENMLSTPLILSLSPNPITPIAADVKSFVHIFEILMSAVFAFLMVFSLILEIILFPSFGVSQTTPFLLISVLNLLLWIFYVQEKHSVL